MPNSFAFLSSDLSQLTAEQLRELVLQQQALIAQQDALIVKKAAQVEEKDLAYRRVLSAYEQVKMELAILRRINFAKRS